MMNGFLTRRPAVALLAAFTGLLALLAIALAFYPILKYGALQNVTQR